MKNILDDKPDYRAEGRLRATTDFVDQDDIIAKNVLNIGCGYGWFELFALDNQVNEVLGIEITEEDLQTIHC